ALGPAAADWAIAAGAFAGGALATAIVAATARGGRDVARIILVGVAVNAVCGGLVSGLTFIAEPAARDRIVFWQMGSFAGGDWTSAAIVAAVTFPSAAVMWALARRLDLLGLGEAQAGHLGVDVVKLRRTVIGLTALVVAVGVAFSGIIVFIGLVVPHALRLILGPGHSALLPASLLGGALVATLADLAARTLVVGADLPLGMLTSLVGGPLFFWLLLRGGRAVRR
ncbi:MAG TPA: iron ABC transporter permease, partial [Corynebacterium sp.]|uniref:FecCD family ABC transporter permease n=1 Tax=Corynebacterium sp. TaxID=1720 RepID=UPI00178E654D